MQIFLDTQLPLLLKKHHISVAQLARSTNVPAKTLYQWTYGHHPRNFNQVMAIAQFFNVSLEYLLFKKEAPVAKESESICGHYEVLVIRKINNSKEGTV